VAPSSLALLTLTVLAVVSPWAFGSVLPLPRFLVVLVALAGSGMTLFASARSQGALRPPGLPLWPSLALLALGLVQLLPLPEGVLRVLAPGSAEVWYPANASARVLLGDGPRPVSIDPGSTTAALLLAGALAALTALAVPALTRGETGLRAATALTVGAAVLALYGIVARGRFGALLYGQIAVPTVSPFGPFVSKNHFAGYMAPSCLLALGLAMGLAGRARASERTRDQGAPLVVSALVAALTMALALFVSQSRGGAVAGATGLLAFGALVIAARREGRSRALIPAVLIAAVVLGFLVVAVPEGARARVVTLEGASFRLDTWRDALSLFRRSPLVGHGFAAFADAFPRAKRGHGEILVEHAENEYVEMLVEGGLLGLGLAVLALLLPARRIGSVLARLSPVRRSLATGGLAGLFALAAHSAFDFNLRIPSNAALAALLAAFAAAATGLRERAPTPATLRALALGFAAAAVAVAVRGPALFDRGRALEGVREEIRSAASATSAEVRSLRVSRARAALAGVLAARPALAEAWLLRAALAREEGPVEESRALAAHAILLDPARDDLRARARTLQQP